jgi:hypothetical protein
MCCRWCYWEHRRKSQRWIEEQRIKPSQQVSYLVAVAEVCGFLETINGQREKSLVISL